MNKWERKMMSRRAQRMALQDMLELTQYLEDEWKEEVQVTMSLAKDTGKELRLPHIVISLLNTYRDYLYDEQEKARDRAEQRRVAESSNRESVDGRTVEVEASQDSAGDLQEVF